MVWVAHDIRDQVVDFVQRWAEPAERACARLLSWIGIGGAQVPGLALSLWPSQ